MRVRTCLLRSATSGHHHTPDGVVSRSMARTEFDAAYYRRFYKDPRRRVGSPESTARLAAFVAAYLAHLEVPIASVLDLGCGLGWWREPALRAFPGARWTGVER